MPGDQVRTSADLCDCVEMNVISLAAWNPQQLPRTWKIDHLASNMTFVCFRWIHTSDGGIVFWWWFGPGFGGWGQCSFCWQCRNWDQFCWNYHWLTGAWCSYQCTDRQNWWVAQSVQAAQKLLNNGINKEEKVMMLLELQRVPLCCLLLQEKHPSILLLATRGQMLPRDCWMLGQTPMLRTTVGAALCTVQWQLMPRESSR